LANAGEDASRAALLLAMSGKADAAAAIQWDAAAKASGKLVPDILACKLWPGARPRWIAQLWKELKQDLLSAQEDWDSGSIGTRRGCKAKPIMKKVKRRFSG
jgi:hypothetical protein